MILAFVGWLMSERKVSSSSISQYMAGLRTVHLRSGVMPGNLRPDMVSSIIKGKAHEEQMLSDKAPRLAMTLTVLKLLKHFITESALLHEEKRLLWVVSCMAFHGSFRIHELLSREAGRFDPTTTLLGCGVRLVKVVVGGVSEEIISVRLKCPKEDRVGEGVTVELFSTGTFSCPVMAWKKWKAVSRLAAVPSKPVFRLPSGACLTGAAFNIRVKGFLGKVINYNEKKYLSHSFRAGEVWFGLFQVCLVWFGLV